jgi:putative ABC transport system substrate-binding protein
MMADVPDATSTIAKTATMNVKISASRRSLMLGAGACLALAGAGIARAQPQTRVFRIGILAPDSVETRAPLVEIFIRAMRDLSYVEGRNVVYEARYASGDTARLSALATELAAQNLDVIVVPNGLATQAAARAAEQSKRPVPIVFAGWATPVGSGLVASLARPGGNATGLTNVTVELVGKQLQLLKDVFPKIARIAVFGDSTTKTGPVYLSEVEGAAKVLGMETLSVEVRGGDDVERNVALLRKWRADSIFVGNNPTNFNSRKLLVQIAQITRLPAIYGNDVYPEIGGLISYGSDDKMRWRQIATFVDKILKGARPGDLPIETPTKFDLVINLKTARALGVTIPQLVLVQADKVIE